METPRFLTPADVAETLNIAVSQVMALIAAGDLLSVQIGGRKVHRIERTELDAYIARLYDEARKRQHAADEATDEDLSPRDLPTHHG